MTPRIRILVLLAGAVWFAVQAGAAAAQQKAERKKPAAAAPQVQQSRAYYDAYLPSERRRMRRETCGKSETAIGAYCVKACRNGYALVAGSRPPKCRSLTPLPPGQMPGPEQKETAPLQLPPRNPGRPEPKASGA